jgi:coenzyme F420 biosynthesis associated uncharacterized protein
MWVAVAGLAVGAVWLDRKARRYSAGLVPPLIDWVRARELAFSLVKNGRLSSQARVELEAIYRDLVQRAITEIAAFTGLKAPWHPVKVAVFDRYDWVDANIVAFQRLLDPAERIHSRISIGRPWTAALIGDVNRFVLSHEIGFLLGYLSHRVLGQYDVAVFGTGPVASGQLYFVEPNIESLVGQLGLPVDDFRLWIALHEASHAFEFESNDWLVGHFNNLLERYFVAAMEELTENGLKRAAETWSRVVDCLRRGQTLVEALLSPRQLAIFHSLQALMAVIEGYSNFVMNSLGMRLIPEFDIIRARFEARQQYRPAPERLFIRLTGLALKLEQYRMGEAFVSQVVSTKGLEFANRLWDGPQYLPTLDELRRPELWINRIESL